MATNKPFAEIIESSLPQFVAQSWQWDTFPTFGSLVVVPNNKRTVIGLVHQINTGSMDGSRHPFPFQKTEQELRQEQPQIFAFLKTSFSCLIIGYQQAGQLYYQLAPEPTKIHSFVHPIAPDLSKQFLYKEQYLPVLFGFAATISYFDELLLAMLTYQQSLNILTAEKINAFTHQFALLTGNDYRRLKLFLHRVEPLVS